MTKANYETIMVFSVKNGEEATNALIEKFKALIEANGEVTAFDDWGVRRLAYDINYESEGHYILVNFTCGPEFPAELSRVQRITEGVLRSLVVSK